ncbi:MAG: glycosyltransferase family 4 protein, partial [Chitinophagales bacterium]|nr:glycosyltransferase family 4 protein [Chitinophagales bacterium]
IYLIRAFNEVNKSDTSLKLLILGDGYLMNECKELAKNNASIIFAGNVNDVSNYYQISHYYITASLSEGMPVSVLEALNHKLPVLLSNINQHAEIVESINSAGLLFDLNNQIDLQNKIKQIVNRDYQQMQQDAYNAVKNQFNADRMSKDYQTIYNQN